MNQRSGTLRRKDRDSPRELVKNPSTTSFESSEAIDKNASLTFKRQILTLLLEENLCLSAFIVSNTKISDSSQPSKYFTEIIQYACKDRLEDFIYQLLEKKIQSHYSKIETVQDMKNVLRDNSLIMLMILQYIKDNCEEYFQTVFQKVVEEIIPHLDLLTVEDDNKEAKEKAERLVQSCVNKIVDAVVTNVDVLPYPIQRVCSVLRIKITSALTKMSEDDVEQDLHSSGLKRKESVNKSDGGGLAELEEEESSNSVVRRSSLARKTSVRVSYIAPVEINEEKVSDIVEEEEDKKASTLRRNKNMGKNVHRKRSKAVANTIVDTILASFLFLRILVPAITSPAQHKIIDHDIAPLQMRGLVQIGRALVSMCNELDLAKTSDKPTTMARLSLNAENKAKIKEFVHEVSIISRSDKEQESNFTIAQASAIEDDKIPIQDEFIQFLINSFPMLDIVIKDQIEKDSNIFRLYEQLQVLLNQFILHKKKMENVPKRRPSMLGEKAKEAKGNHYLYRWI